MAGNQTRTVELQIKLQGVQSLQELEQITSEINDELKQVDINSEEFKKLGSMAQRANSRVKEIGQSLEGVTSTEKSEAINKMGAALLGVFQGAAGASLLFGEQTSEQMNKAIKAVGGLFAITDSVKKVTEAFSVQNISRLKAVVKGWNEAAAGAKIFGISVKSALISTGIGALVVALGLIVANFDKIKNLVNGTGRELGKNLETQTRTAEVMDASEKAASNITAKAKEMAELSGQYKDYADAMVALETLREKSLQAQLDKLKAEAAVQQNILDTTNKKRDKYKEAEKQLAILNTQIAEQNVALLFNQKVEQERAKQYQIIVSYVQAVNNILADTKNELILIQSYEYNRAMLYKKQREELTYQQFLLKLYRDNGIGLNKQQAEQLKTLEAQIIALDNQNDLRIRDTKLAIEKLKQESEYNDELRKETSLVEFLARVYDEITQSNEEQLAYEEKNLKNVEYENELYTKIAEIRNEIVNFDKKGLELFNEFYQEYQLLYQSEAERLGIQEDFNKLTKEQQRIFGEQLQTIKQTSDAKLKLFNTELKNNDALLDNLDEQKEAQQEIVETAQERVFELEKERDRLQKLLKENKGILEAELDLGNKIKEVNDEINGVVDTRTSAENEISNIVLKQNQILETNKNIQADIDSTVQETADAQKEVTYEIEKQVRLSSQLKNFISDYAEEIETTRQLIGQTFELMATMNDARAEDKQREIDAFLAAEEEKTDIVARNAEAQADAKAKAEEAYNDRIMELYDMLADAEGEHYDDLLDEIAAQEAAKEEAYRAEIDRQNAEGLAEWQKNDTLAKMENEKAMYEYRAAKQRKIAAIIDATIQTALATIKALPNVVLAGITAALGVAGIATISAQKLPPEPAPYESQPYVPIPYKKGGYTGEGDVNQPAGIVHAGEYVVPQFVMKNPKAIPMVQTLEGMRQRGYAEGGYVTTPAMAAEATQSAIDYKMIGTEVANAMKDNPMFVSWKEWRDINSKMEFVYSRAGLRKR